MSEQNVGVVRAAYEAFGRGDMVASLAVTPLCLPRGKARA